MMFSSVGNFRALVPFFLVLLPCLAQNSIDAQHEATGFPPCDILIAAGLGDRLVLATSDAYEPRVASWWSANARFRPWCFFLPTTTYEVSVAIAALDKTGSGAGDWHIAVRSGGHGFPGSNNIAKGVTIDLGNMNGSWYDAERQVASVQPGGRWKDVYANLLDIAQVTVTGGRDGGVGVGGFLLGGGVSYHTGTNGFACNTVTNYEVVLANGTIVQANGNKNSDLWKALKGGGLNFGIVTRFDLEAQPAVDLAYGQNVLIPGSSDEVIDTVVEFTDRSQGQPHDHLITMYASTPGNKGVSVIAIRVNTQGDLNETAFDRLNKIPTVSSTWAKMSLADAANASQAAGGTRNTQSTLTFLNSPKVLRYSAVLLEQLMVSLSEKIGAENFAAQMVLQPFPKLYSDVSQSKGGNMLGVERIESNAILWVGGVAVFSDDAALAIAQAESGAMTEKLKAFIAKEGATTDFIYMNYADPSQDFLGSYGSENLLFMKQVANHYDPKGWWQYRVGARSASIRVTPH
ncbi:hypothetical protein BDV95DRAFT_645249 [Massariosphaeria phaeospora]|uniref:FAD-binding PCMH-type domain-containing protein n=1 Tax=Massariosphaeria phaeospora TaxID=100035 RepID=A0A7C8MK88_9PLEO|nr:hypothetical protein BDV95DRAFT_645249 [Massariosphaeria phaeospora]